MKRLIFALVLAGVCSASANAADSPSWVFQRSYYSHDPITPVQIGREPTGGPYYTRPFGGYVRSGYRNLNSSIRVGGMTFDQLNIWESWAQFGSQY